MSKQPQYIVVAFIFSQKLQQICWGGGKAANARACGIVEHTRHADPTPPARTASECASGGNRKAAPASKPHAAADAENAAAAPAGNGEGEAAATTD